MNIPMLTLTQQAGPLKRLIYGKQVAASELARETDAVFMAILYFDIFWFVMLMGLMFYWVVKYRRRPGVPAQRTAHHNTRLELVWTIVPSVFLGAMFYYGFDGYLAKLVAPTHAETINIEGRKWDWVATYDNGANPPKKMQIGGKNEAPIIYIPVGRPVQFRMTSQDVLHSFWIPDFRFKFDVMPNRYTNFWIEAEEPGVHWIFCAEYCGDYHSEMAAQLKAVPADEYDRLKGEWAIDLSLPPAVLGEQMVRTRGGCIACHTIDGATSVGPTWLNAWGYEVVLTDGNVIPGDDPEAWDNYIRTSILNSNAQVHAGFPAVMSSFAGVFSEQELGWIVEYIKSLSDKSVPPADSEPTESLEQ
jgi:cytochrome c oxidase subunit 2